MVNDLGNTSIKQNERLIQLLKEQLAHSNKQNNELTNKLDQSLKQIDVLTEQVRQLAKLYMVLNQKNQSIKHQTNKALYLKMIRFLAILSRQKNKARKQLAIPLSVKYRRKSEMIHFVMALKSKKFTIIRLTLNVTVAFSK